MFKLFRNFFCGIKIRKIITFKTGSMDIQRICLKISVNQFKLDVQLEEETLYISNQVFSEKKGIIREILGLEAAQEFL